MRTFQSWGRRLLTAALTMGVTTGLGVVSAAPAHAVPGFSSGSFESPVVAPNTFQRIFIGESIGEWTVSQGDVDLIGEGFWQAASGGQVAVQPERQVGGGRRW